MPCHWADPRILGVEAKRRKDWFRRVQCIVPHCTVISIYIYIYIIYDSIYIYVYVYIYIYIYIKNMMYYALTQLGPGTVVLD